MMKIKTISTIKKTVWKSKDDLQEGDFIWTFNRETKEKELKPINKIISKKSNNFIKILSDDYEQYVTEEHNVLMNDFSFKKAKKLKIGDVLVGDIKIKNIENIQTKEQDVWCVNTDNNTVYAKRHDKEFLTGNSQPPFSNVTLDLFPPEDLKNTNPKIGGKKMPFTYGDLQAEMNMFNKAFFEVFEKGDYTGNLFQYPIPTLNCTPAFFENLDPDVEESIYRLTGKFGPFYFSNYINSDMNPSDTRSMCCRLRLDLRQLTRKNGSLFGAGDNTGSIGVVTINLPKIGYLSKTKEELFERIALTMNIAKRSLEIKRERLNEWFDRGLYPYTKRYLKAKYENHFSTIGLVGMNEMCRNFFRNMKKKDWDISTKEGYALTLEILDFMREKCSDFQEETGNLYNLESTPAESTAFRLAKHDKLKYPDILTAGTLQKPYYTNSSNLPVNFTENPWPALMHQENIQVKYTGGTVFHTFLGEGIEDISKIKDFIKKVMTNTKLPYITITPTFSHCQIHGFIKGNVHGICPECKAAAVENYTKKLKELEVKKEALEAN